MITYEERKKAIDEFAEKRNSNMLGLAFYRPDPNSIPTHCIQNVLSKINRDGGDIKYGWTFHHRTNVEYGDYLFATHHAVWYNPAGTLDDITPFHTEEKHQPITEQGDVLFLVDDNATPISANNMLYPRPLIFFPVRKELKIMEYIEVLTKQEMDDYRTSFGVDPTLI